MKHLIFFIISLLLCGVSQAAADVRSPYEVNFRNPARLEKKLSRLTKDKQQKSLTFSIRVPNEGVLRVVLESVSRYTLPDGHEMVLLQGYAQQKRGNRTGGRFGPLQASGTVRGRDTGAPLFDFSFSRESRRGIRRFYRAMTKGPLDVSRLSRAPQFALPLDYCDDPDHLGATPLLPKTSEFNVGATSTLREVEVATYADPSWRSHYGTNDQGEIISLINAADNIYRHGLGLTLTVVNQSTSNPSSSTNASTLLESFASTTTQRADVSYLFTGKDLDGTTIGIAYVGVVCNAPFAAYGVMQQFNDSLENIIFAHELGHNLSADHASSGIMGTTLNPRNPATTFSASSVASITNHVSRNNACLAQVTDVAPTPAPTPTPIPTPRGGGGTNPAPTPAPTPVPPGPTPDPRATPVPPVATPTPPGQGGGGGSVTPGQPGMSVSMSTSLVDRQTIQGTLDIKNPTGVCSAKFYVAKNVSKYTRGTLLGEAITTDTVVQFSGTFSKKLKNRKRVKKVFLVAEVHCAGSQDVVVSSVINTRKVRIRGKTGYKRWIRDFAATFGVS